jgi:hypothetical protein
MRVSLFPVLSLILATTTVGFAGLGRNFLKQLQTERNYSATALAELEFAQKSEIKALSRHFKAKGILMPAPWTIDVGHLREAAEMLESGKSPAEVKKYLKKAEETYIKFYQSGSVTKPPSP